MESQFDLSQLLTIWKTTLNFESRISGLLSVTKMLVSSAKIIGID
jgi:nicotinate-nucleotide pyrophosphorylase